MKVELVESSNPDETLDVGRRLASQLRGGEVVLLQGPMGSGKSVLARGIVDALLPGAWRGSPTFTIVNEYHTSPAIHHADLYRLGGQETSDLGLEEYVRTDAVLVVEWPERAGDHLSDLARSYVINIELQLIGPSERKISLAGLQRPLFEDKSR